MSLAASRPVPTMKISRARFHERTVDDFPLHDFHGRGVVFGTFGKSGRIPGQEISDAQPDEQSAGDPEFEFPEFQLTKKVPQGHGGKQEHQGIEDKGNQIELHMKLSPSLRKNKK